MCYLLSWKWFATNAALVFGPFLVFLQMFAHDGRSQGHIVALVALWKFGVRRRRNSVDGKQVEQHMIALNGSVTTKFTGLKKEKKRKK